MHEFWLQQLLVYWHQFLAEWHDTTAPKLDENMKLIQPTLTEFMSWLVTKLDVEDSL